MKNFVPVFLAIVGVIHFSHVAMISGFPDNYVDPFVFEDPSNDTNTTTVAPGPGNDTTTVAPGEDTTTDVPTNDTTTATTTYDTTTTAPTNDTTSASPGTTTHSPTTTKKSPPKSGNKGSTFNGASFAGGVGLGFGVLLLAGVAYTIYRRRATQQYNAM